MSHADLAALRVLIVGRPNTAVILRFRCFLVYQYQYQDLYQYQLKFEFEYEYEYQD